MKEKSLFTEKIFLVVTARTQKETSNTFDSCIIKLFQGYCLYLAIEEITQVRRVQKKKKKGHTRFTRSVRKRRRERTEKESDTSRRCKGENNGSLFTFT